MRLFLFLMLLLGVAPAAVARQETAVAVVLKWEPQAQFGGYYAAHAMGYWADEGLDVEVIAAGIHVDPQTLVTFGQAQFGVDWMTGVLFADEVRNDVINIAQLFQRGAVRQVTWADSGLDSLDKLEETRVGVWPGANAYPILTGLNQYNVIPRMVTLVEQDFTMNAFINREIDSAQATTYNELAQILEYVDEDGNFPVYTLDDLYIIDFNEVGTALLEDGLFVDEDWLAQPGNEEIAVQFLRGAFRGWVHCRDNPEDCVQFVMAADPLLGEGHQRWMMNEVNKLIWPSPEGIGALDETQFEVTAGIALEQNLITDERRIGEGYSYRTDLAAAALDGLAADFPDLDLVGDAWAAPTVEITPNGE